MAALPVPFVCISRYRASFAPRLWRLPGPLPTAMAVLALGLAASGCSVSYQLGALFGSEDEKAETTGSVAPRQRDSPPGSDLAFASAAASDALAKGGKDASWQNPNTGARGTVTPIAAAYRQGGFLCRDFLSSYVVEDNESWLQGEACRIEHGKWVVRSLKLWNRTEVPAHDAPFPPRPAS